MVKKLKRHIGAVLIGGFLLSGELPGQQAWAHSLPNPNCRSLPKAAFFTTTETAARASGTLTTKKGTDNSGEGNKNYYYGKITVPALTAGELDVSDAGTGPSEAILCGRQEGSATSFPSYASAHNNADSAAATATRAATAANQTGASRSTAKSALLSAADALTTVATALTAAGETSAASTATSVASTARTTANDANNDASAMGSGLTTAASALTTAANALASHTGFDINALISSGDEEYIVVVSIPSTETTPPQVSVSFEGIMAAENDAQSGQDGGSFTTNNQRITHTLATTANTPGLLTVRTTGNAVDTEGTLAESTTTIATDDGVGGNFEIVSPVDDSTTYSLHVDGQTRDERGDYGLKMEFGVATDLTLGTSPTATALEPGRADYFFFTVAANTYNFLNVETQKPTSATKETDTTGTLFSQQGQVATDTNSGAGRNFWLGAPISPGNYIVEVKGASSSTEGAYTLVTSIQAVAAAQQHGSAPNSIDGSNEGTIAARSAVLHSIVVTTPGTLQAKTTGTTDTYGTLYGPDGKQLATDDDSGDGMNFKITQAVGVGTHIVRVEGKSETTTGDYTLVVNFIEGAALSPTDPTDPTDPTCPDPVTTHARGTLENPSNNGYRSGIGVISGWVCAANEVEVKISNAQGVVQKTFAVGYGTSRPDTVGSCRHNSANTGFGMTYNFNHLPEGTYTITAYADDQQIGEPRTFEVVHIADFAATDTDRFLRLEDDVKARGECIVSDFPVTGERTWLKWEESTQNFVIEDQG